MAEGSFEKKFRLLSASDFNQLKVGSQSFKKASIIVYYKKNSFDQSRIGLAVSKKIGKANVRNRLKRLLRESFRLSPYKFLGFDMLVVVSWSRRIQDESADSKEQILIQNINEFFNFLSTATNDK